MATCYIVVSVVTWTFSKGLKLVWRLPTITQLKLTLSPWTYIYWTDSSKSTWCLRSTKTIRLIRDGEKEGGRGMEGGEEGDYIPVATLSPPE